MEGLIVGFYSFIKMNRKMLRKYLLLIVVCLGMAPAQAGLGAKIKEKTKAAVVWQHKMSSLYNRAGWEVLAAPFAFVGGIGVVYNLLGREKGGRGESFLRVVSPITPILHSGSIAAFFLATANTSYDVAGTLKTRWNKRKAAKKEALEKAEQPAPVEGATSGAQPA